MEVSHLICRSTRLVAALGGCLVLGLVGCTPEPTDPCPPDCNVLLISIDTLRADHMSTYGYERETTPKIDAFAADAWVFENAISQSAWTTPAHASMMTGLYPAEHGLVYYSDPGTIRDENLTLAEILRRRGYRTGGFAGGGYVSDDFGFNRGFEIYESGRWLPPNTGDAISWMVRHRRERFFAFVHGFDVHRPYESPERFDLFNETGQEWDIARFCNPGKRNYESPEHLEYIISQYDAGIRYADDSVATLLDNLEREGLLDRTIVIITSDHGDEFFEHGECDHITSLYQELVHVPLIVRVPGRGGARIESRVAASVGVTPTVLELLEIDFRMPEHRSWLPSVEGTGSPRPILAETGWQTGHLRAVVEGRFKLVLRTMAPTKEIPEVTETLVLFDLEDDPGELTDVSTEHPEVVARLEPLLRERAIPERQPVRKFSGELEKELESLGYLN